MPRTSVTSPRARDRGRRRTGRTDLYIVGLGIRGAWQVTKETERVLRACRRVFAIAPTPQMRSYLRAVCSDVVDLRSLYVEGQPRRRTYEAMAEAVIAGAKTSRPVAFAVYGHPLLYVTTSDILIERAPRNGLAVKVLPAVSSVDCLLVDLGINPGTAGLQMYEASDMLLRQRPLQPDVPGLILQPGVVESPLHSLAEKSPRQFLRLKRYLLRFYPPRQQVVVVTCDMGPRIRPERKRTHLANLEKVHKFLHDAATLYIPPRE